MNDPQTHVISVRAIEDIMQIQKLLEESRHPKEINIENKKSEERIVFSILKHDLYSPDPENNRSNNILKECDIENSFKCTDKTCKRLERDSWEGNCEFTKFVNPDVVVLENFGIFENTCSEAEVKCWSSDSDITILRVKKEYRNELSNKVEWEEQRNLENDASLSSVNLDWESHSLINLAEVSSQEKDVDDILTPFTIWTKSQNNTRNSSMIFVENLNSLTPSTPEVKLAVDGVSEILEENKKKAEAKKKSKIKNKFIKNVVHSAFNCFKKKKKSIYQNTITKIEEI